MVRRRKRQLRGIDLWLVACALAAGLLLVGAAGRADGPEGESGDADESTSASAEPAEKLLEPIFDLEPHESDNYVLYANKSPQMVADVLFRLEAMHEEYRGVMSKHYRPTAEKFKVFLFDNRERFIAAGGHSTMPGISITHRQWPGPRLMMMCPGGRLEVHLDHLLRHEVWHHFCAANLPGDFPIWLDEGLAEFFGYAVWTGDGVIYGLVRPEAYHSLIGYVQDRRILPLSRLLKLTGGQWYQTAGTDAGWRGYMQSWSFVNFLMTANRGRYGSDLRVYIDAICDGRSLDGPAQRLRSRESAYRKWLSSLTPTFTHEKVYEAVVAILTSHLARAHARGQRFTSADRFMDLAREGRLNLPPVGEDQWLPPSLMRECFWMVDQMDEAYKGFEVRIVYQGDQPTLRLTADYVDLDLEGRFSLVNGDVKRVDVRHLKPVPADLEAGKKRARARRRGPGDSNNTPDDDDSPVDLPPGL